MSQHFYNFRSNPIRICKIDKEKKDSKEVEKLTLEENFVFQDDEAYIFLKTTTNKRYVLYYWLGKTTTVKKKLKAASLVVNLWNELLDKSVARSNVPPISRVLQGEESEYFKRHFHNRISDFQVSQDTINSELYEIRKNKHGIVKIVLVPLSSLKFDQNKCYVLGAENGIFVYVGNEEQKELTMNLANHIMDDSMYLMNGSDNLNKDCGIQSSSNTFADQLFEIKHVTEAEFSLLVDSSWMIQKSTYTKVRALLQGCYILKNKTLRYLYIVIGPICHVDSVHYCLQEGEKFAEVSNKWKKVIVVSGHRLPAIFLANFPDFGKILSENQKFRNFSDISYFYNF